MTSNRSCQELRENREDTGELFFHSINTDLHIHAYVYIELYVHDRKTKNEGLIMKKPGCSIIHLR